ncbi:MAG: MarR family transcriptional regulator [Lachnospiraceae bacterium]|nr:MarR family transcriptional regulator [Lachnospiraceae bacterium]
MMQNFIQILKMINDNVEKITNKQLKEYGITFSQIRIIFVLYRSEKGVYSLKELEKIFDVSQQTMAGIVKRLEVKKLIESLGDSEDKRIKRVQLTDSGRELGKVLLFKMDEVEEKLLSGISQSERKELMNILKRVYENVIIF